MGGLAKAQERVAASGAAAAAGSAKSGAAMAALGKVARVGALSLAAIGLEAVKMSVNFNHEMLKIRTDAGASTKELANMKKGVLELASSGASMGQGPMSLAQGLYHLESLGQRGSRALKALALASQESAISGANLEQTTTAMGAAMYVGIKGTGNLTQLMGTLNATVGAGNMRFQNLVDALGTGLLPAAKVAGLSIQDVGASLAVLTDAGFPASSSAAQLGTALHFLYAPTSKASTALKSIGLTSTSLAQDMHKPQGMLSALSDLKKHLSGLSDVAKAQVLNAILPGGRGKVLLTELTMLDRLKGKYDQINKTAGGFQGSVAQQRKDPGTQLKMGEARAQASLIGIGNVLTPIVLPALAKLLVLGAKVLDWLKNAVIWLKHHTNAAKALGVVLLGVVAAFGSTVIAVAAVVAAIVYAWTHFKVFRTVVKAVADAVVAAVKWLGNAFIWLWQHAVRPAGDAIIAIVSSLWNAFLQPIFNAIGSALHTLGGVFNWLWKNVVQPVWTAISGAITTAWGVIQPILSALGSAFQTAFGIVLQVVNAVLAPIQAVVGAVGAVSSAVNSINPFGGGGPSQSQINKGTPAQLGAINHKLSGLGLPGLRQTAAPQGPLTHTGHFGRNFQTVTPLNPGAGLVIHSHLHVDGREIARAMRRQVINAQAAGA